MKANVVDSTILVTGATGQQGGATARRLLAGGYSVRALVRDPKSPGAQGLANLGARLAVGDMDNTESLRNAMRGVYGVFSVQPALIPPKFAEHELQRGMNVADAARVTGVRHFVYSSVAGADRRTGIPHWEIKGQIEERIRSLGVPFTILRPTLFMDMYADATYGLTGTHSLVRTLPSNALIQHIAIDDIAAFTALALGSPSRYLCKAIELAGDEMTVDQILAAISRASGHHDLRAWTTGASAAPAASERLVRYGGWNANIRSLRALHPGLMTFETWLAKGGAALIDRTLARSNGGSL